MADADYNSEAKNASVEGQVGNLSYGGGRLSRDAADLLVRHLAMAASRSVPLPEVLEALADDVGDRRLAAAAHQLAERLRSGDSIDQALRDLESTFPPPIRGLVVAGLKANNLPAVLEGYAELALEQRNIKTTIRTALAYPMLIGVLLIPLLLLLSLYVAPLFEELFHEFELELPESTVTAFRTARVAPIAIAALFVVAAGVAAILSLVGGHWFLHRLRGAIPVFGPLWTWAGQYEFAALLETMVAARLPLPDAVGAVADGLSDRNVARACPHVLRGVEEEGLSLGAALERSMHFDRILPPLAAWGEAHGILEEALSVARRTLHARLENYAAMLRRVIPVVALVVVATFVMGIAVVGFLMPLFELISGLSG
jgi:type II secretory pathway component PulF